MNKRIAGFLIISGSPCDIVRCTFEVMPTMWRKTMYYSFREEVAQSVDYVVLISVHRYNNMSTCRYKTTA